MQLRHCPSSHNSPNWDTSFRTLFQDTISGHHFRTLFQDIISGHHFRTSFQDIISGHYFKTLIQDIILLFQDIPFRISISGHLRQPFRTHLSGHLSPTSGKLLQNNSFRTPYICDTSNTTPLKSVIRTLSMFRSATAVHPPSLYTTHFPMSAGNLGIPTSLRFR
jgi:hypothetical protein